MDILQNICVCVLYGKKSQYYLFGATRGRVSDGRIYILGSTVRLHAYLIDMEATIRLLSYGKFKWKLNQQ